MHDEHNMSKKHQVWWASLHLPFHISLVLMLEGANQFIIWRRVSESITKGLYKVVSVLDKLPDPPTSQQVSDGLKDVVLGFLKDYEPAEVLETYNAVNETLTDIAELPQYLWESDDLAADDENLAHWTNDLLELSYTMMNAVYNKFGIEAEVESTEESGATTDAEHNEYVQVQALEALDKRYMLVVRYPLIRSREHMSGLMQANTARNSLSTHLSVLVLFCCSSPSCTSSRSETGGLRSTSSELSSASV